MRIRWMVIVMIAVMAWGEELRVFSDTFRADRSVGTSVFTGHVRVMKGSDELNASKLTITLDRANHPIKYVAEGAVSFTILTEAKERYQGKAQTLVYFPNEHEYQFFKNVDLIRLDEYRRIKGDKVLLNTYKGTASADSSAHEPVMMIFNIDTAQRSRR